MVSDLRAQKLAEENYCLRMQVEKLQLVRNAHLGLFKAVTVYCASEKNTHIQTQDLSIRACKMM